MENCVLLYVYVTFNNGQRLTSCIGALLLLLLFLDVILVLLYCVCLCICVRVFLSFIAIIGCVHRSFGTWILSRLFVSVGSICPSVGPCFVCLCSPSSTLHVSMAYGRAGVADYRSAGPLPRRQERAVAAVTAHLRPPLIGPRAPCGSEQAATAS